MTATPNHALQRTATAVTARASAAAFPPAMHGPRQPPPSLSLGSLGRMRSFILTMPLMASLLSGCSFLSQKPWPSEILAMQRGESITAETSGGNVTIAANDVLTRTVTWEGASRSVRLVPPSRESFYPPEIPPTRIGPFSFPRHDRWTGVAGAISWDGVVPEHNGITRIFLQEGQQRFETADSALSFLREPAFQPSVYNDDGVVIRFSKTPGSSQLDVSVYQIYIGDRKPTHLPGSQNKNIHVIRHTLQMRPNHALQRTAPRVTVAAISSPGAFTPSHRCLTPVGAFFAPPTQLPRHATPSLSLGSLGVSSRVL